jgi:general secretion pathway protein D
VKAVRFTPIQRRKSGPSVVDHNTGQVRTPAPTHPCAPRFTHRRFPPTFPCPRGYNLGMRWAWHICAIAALSTAGVCADQPSGVILTPCAQASNCEPSRQDIKKAAAAFDKGVKLRDKNLDEAFKQFERAAELSPRDVNYVTAREVVRQQLVLQHLERGNSSLDGRHPIEAQAAFRQALFLDPQNEFAKHRLNDVMAEWAPKQEDKARVIDPGGEIRTVPNSVEADFHYRGEGRTLLSQVATAYGVKATLDDSVPTRQVRFDLGKADFATAMQAVCAVTKTFWIPLDSKQILVAMESAENHRAFDRMSMRTFYVPISAAQDLTDLNNILRNLFDIRFITPQPAQGTLIVRAPQNVLDAATKVIEGLNESRPQVMLDIKVYEISHQLTRNIGLTIPNQFQLTNIPAAALLALAGTNVQDLINQLISGGGINQANNSTLSNLLSQLQNQQNSLFTTPQATFGNGQTLFGLSLGTVGGQLQLNESWVRNLQHVTLRTGQGSDANFHLGSRYPILNASFAPIANSAAISKVIQNQSFIAPFPSFSYEDLGLTIKAKTAVSRESDVSIALEMQLRSLLGDSLNGVPFLSNREFKGSINLRDGEPAIVTSSVSHDEIRTLSGIPGFGYVPGLNQVMTNNSKQEDDDELLVLITPHVINAHQTVESSEVWLQK